MEEDVSEIKKGEKIMREKKEYQDDTSPEEIEEDVSDTKNDSRENNDKEKQIGCLYDTSTRDMEDDMCD